jgi:dTDP-4-dehydrorhamnose 3,5-epimerase-like enzyme
VKFVPTRLEGAYAIEPEPNRDERGLFARRWERDVFAERGLATEVFQTAGLSGKNEVHGFRDASCPTSAAR